MSSTVTVAEQVLLLPFLSVTVKVTVFAPTFVQSKLVLLKTKLSMPQASVEPLFTAAAVVLPAPCAFNCTVIFWQFATGATLSSTVTVAEHVEVLPLLSVTVRVTVLAPIFVQSKLVLLKARLAMPEASLEPLFTAAAVVLPVPWAFNCTVTF